MAMDSSQKLHMVATGRALRSPSGILYDWELFLLGWYDVYKMTWVRTQDLVYIFEDSDNESWRFLAGKDDHAKSIQLGTMLKRYLSQGDYEAMKRGNAMRYRLIFRQPVRGAEPQPIEATGAVI